MKKLHLVKIKCQCGHTNLVPVYEVFHVFEPIRCGKCGKVIAEQPKIEIGKDLATYVES